MPRAIDDLAELLEKQIKNYADLKGLILEKRKTIIANDLKGLTETTQRIESLIGSNNRLEIGRMELVKKMAEKLALSGGKPTLLAIAECFEGAEREKLLDLRRRATEAINEVQRQNRINAELLKYSAELLDSVLKSLVEGNSLAPTYGSDGETKNKGASVPLLDQQV